MLGNKRSKRVYLCATALSTALVMPAWAGTFPTGVFLVIDPYSSGDMLFLEQAASGENYTSLFGSFTGTCPGTTCAGGITGIFLKVNWINYQIQLLNGSATQLSIGTDNPSPSSGSAANYTGQVETALGYISELESSLSQTFNLSIGLEGGYNASFPALDVYQLSGGGTVYSGSTLSLTSDIGCGFELTSNGQTITGNGKTSSAGSLFPEQCILKSATPDQCNPEANIFGSSSASELANGYYVSAYSAAVLTLAHQITNGGTTATGSIVPGHQIDILKLSGVADHDVEVGVNGNPGLAMPSSNGTTYICGYVSAEGVPATDAEAIWTDQSNAGTNYYDTGIMETTFAAIVSNVSTLIATPTGGTITNFAIDVYGDNDFPPVGPRHCHYPTQCTYTPAGSSSIVTYTTGEAEYLIEQSISDGGLLHSIAHGNFSVQTQGLTDTLPSEGEGNYYTNEIPCAMQSHYHTAIGYQSLASQSFTSSANNTSYLNSLSNGVTYGAEYEELASGEIKGYLGNGGTTSTLSSTMYSAASQMVTNKSSNSGTTLCPATTGTFTTY